MIDEQIVLLAPGPPAGGVERALVVTVDITSGEVTEIDLPKVHVGPVEPVSQDPWASYLYNSPSFTVDRAGQRVLVAHANESFITEVDLSTGQAIQQCWPMPVPHQKRGPGDGARSALTVGSSTLPVETSNSSKTTTTGR